MEVVAVDRAEEPLNVLRQMGRPHDAIADVQIEPAGPGGAPAEELSVE